MKNKIKEEIDVFKALLEETGMETVTVDKAVVLAKEKATGEDTSFINAFRGLSDSNAPPESMGYQIYIALQNVNASDLDNLSALKSV